MDLESLVEATPLVRGELREHRSEIKTNLVRAGLARVSEEFRPGDIVKRLRRETGIGLDHSSVVNALDGLAKEGMVGKEEGGVYRRHRVPDVPTFKELTEPSWEAFKGHCRGTYPDLDLEFLDSEAREAFDEFILGFTSHLTSHLEEEEFQVEKVDSFNVEAKAKELAESYDIGPENQFVEALRSFTQDPPTPLLELTNTIFHGVVNLDLLDRESVIDLGSLEIADSYLYVDTNVMVALFCRTDPRHDLISAVCAKANAIGLQLGYSEETRQEMSGLVRGAKGEMRSLPKNPDASVVDSQFLEDFIERDTRYWSEYEAELENWENLLQTQWGLENLAYEEQPDEKAVAYVEDVVPRLEGLHQRRARHGEIDPKSEGQLDHDSRVLGHLARDRKNMPVGPWLLTFDEGLIAVGEIGKDHMEWGDGIAVHVKEFLEYLVAFQPAELDDSNDERLIEGLIRYTVREEDEGLGLDDYVDLIAPRYEMEEAPRDVVMDIFLKHPMKETLEEAIEENRGGEAARITQSILGSEEHITKVVDQKETRERLRTAQETANKYREKYEREKEAKEALKDQSISIAISATASAEAEARAEASALDTQIEELVGLINARIGGEWEEHDVPSPPSGETSLSEVRDWLISIKEGIETSEVLHEKLASLQPFIHELISDVQSILG